MDQIGRIINIQKFNANKFRSGLKFVVMHNQILEKLQNYDIAVIPSIWMEMVL